MTFENLGIRQEIVRALANDGIEAPTSIQEKAIPLILAGRDVIGMSKTGSGKTAAFGIPIVQNIDPNGGLQALVMAPTRELVVQIAKELRKFSKNIKCEVAEVFGGVSLGPQVKAMKTAHIVVSTPGRTLDHLERETMDLSYLKCFALDEADKMVDMGFIDDITRILRYAPKDRQVLLFGATISREIDRLREQYMNNPETAKADTQVKEEFLEQYYYDVQPHEKFSLLLHLMNKEDTQRVIVFCSTRNTVEIVSKNLRAQGVKSEMIHGKLSQNRRLRVIENFNKGRPTVLVASAVAARGLDIRDVSHVFNYDLSRDPQEYIHRVGRTARAGESGVAYTLLSPKDHEVFNAVLGRYPIKVDKLQLPEFEKVRFKARQDSRYGDRRGGRRSFGSPRRGGFGNRRDRSRNDGGRKWGERK